MDYIDALNYVESSKSLGIMLGLERVKFLLDKLDNPQDKVKIIHVAGTNGKGSVCAMLARILTEAGYKTGQFNSPVIFDFREQFKIDGVDISERQLIEVVKRVKAVAESMEDHPTEFEIIVAMAYMYFYLNNCDIAVVEVGMGGLLDATNIMRSTEASVIVNIDYDHMGFLGNTLEEIATNKAGIIKEKGTVILADQRAVVMDVVKAIAANKMASVFISDNDAIKIISQNVEETVFSYKTFKDLKLALIGEHQTRNAAIVLEVIEQLISKGYEIPEDAIRKGLSKVSWPGRFQLYKKNPDIIVDGAHNPHGIMSLVENLKTYYGDSKFIFIVGILGDKDYSEMISQTIPFAREYITIAPDNPRALTGEACGAAIKAAGFEGNIYVAKDMQDAAAYALAQQNSTDSSGLVLTGHTPICVFGSLYNVKGISEAFEEMDRVN